jgi:hypothetical protein
MDEMYPTLQPSLEAALSEFYAAPRPDPTFAARLEAQLRQRQARIVAPGRNSRIAFLDAWGSFTQTLRARPLLALLVIFLALLALTGMAYALSRASGFIPGFGFTSGRGSVYVLAEPLEDTAGGVTLRVNQAVNDGGRFWVEMSADGLVTWQDFSEAYVLLPGGEKIRSEAGQSSGPENGEVKLSYLFPPLAGETHELTLLVEGLGGEDFSLPLKLRSAVAGEVVPALPEADAPLKSESHNGLRLVLDHIAVDSRKTVIQVSLHYAQPNTGVAGPWNVILSDAAGIPYPLTDVTPGTMTGDEVHVYQTVPFTGREQLTLRLASFPSGDTLPLFVDFSGDSPAFIFDPGAHPEAGQRWELNRSLSAGGFDLKVVSATLMDQPGLVFEVEPGASVTGVMFRSPDPLVTGSTGGVPAQGGNLSAGMTFSSMPQRPIEVRLMRVYYQAKGPWIIHWQPPAAPTPAPGIPTATTAPTLAALPSPTLAASNPLLQEVQQLAKKFDASFQGGPGWVHVVKETHTNPQAGQDFPPPYLKNEQWVEVDAGGYVTRRLYTDYGEGGQIIQQSVTVGDYTVNFTIGDAEFNRGVRYQFSLDLLSRVFNQAAQSSSSVTQEESTCQDGRRCLLVTLLGTSLTRVQNPGITQAFSGYAGRRVWIDPQSGQQVQEQSFWRLADSSEKISSTSRYILVEKVESPPQEVLNILARVHRP